MAAARLQRAAVRIPVIADFLRSESSQNGVMDCNQWEFMTRVTVPRFGPKRVVSATMPCTEPLLAVQLYLDRPARYLVSEKNE